MVLSPVPVLYSVRSVPRSRPPYYYSSLSLIYYTLSMHTLHYTVPLFLIKTRIFSGRLIKRISSIFISIMSYFYNKKRTNESIIFSIGLTPLTFSIFLFLNASQMQNFREYRLYLTIIMRFFYFSERVEVARRILYNFTAIIGRGLPIEDLDVKIIRIFLITFRRTS